MVQQEWAGAEDLSLLVGQLGVAAQVDPRMVRVRGAPYGHNDHIAALRLTDW